MKKKLQQVRHCLAPEIEPGEAWNQPSVLALRFLARLGLSEATLLLMAIVYIILRIGLVQTQLQTSNANGTSLAAIIPLRCGCILAPPLDPPSAKCGDGVSSKNATLHIDRVQ